MHPGWRRCSSLKYSRYSWSSRLAIRAPHRSRCNDGVAPRTVNVHMKFGTPDNVFKSARDLAAMIRSRDVSGREVMAAHLRQIDRINPIINAIVAKLDDDE